MMDPLFFLNLPLQHLSIDTKSAGRRLFIYTKDIEPLADDEVVGTIEAVQKRFEQEFAPQCARLAHYLHERMAKGSKIEESHSLWLRTQEPIAASMAEAKSKAKSYYKYIPLMDDTQKIMRAAFSMLYIEALSGVVEDKNAALCRLLTSQQHKSALGTYKTQVKACESLGNKAPLEEKITSLSKIFAETMQQLETARYHLQGKDQGLRAETISLYQEVFLFCQYTANCLAKELPPQDTSDLGKQIASLTQSIKKTLPPHLAGVLDTQAQIENPEILYVQQSRTTTLPTENHFRNGMWGVSFFYNELKAEIDKLQDIAKALYRLNSTLQERIKQMAYGQSQPAGGFEYLDQEAAHYSSLIDGLERLIYMQLQQLAKKPLSKKAHAGWYYVADLLAQVRDLRLCAEQFSQLANGPYRFCVLALGKLIRYLDVAHLEGDHAAVWLEPTQRLFEATEAARTLSEKSLTFHKRAFKVIHQSIAVAGLRTLKLSDVQSTIPSRLFTKAPLGEHEHELLISYLTKNLLRLTRFAESPFDPEFEIVLHMLRHEAAYEESFLAILKRTPLVEQLHATYLAKSRTNDYYIELELMKCACIALNNASNSTSKHAAPLGYYEAKQLLEDLKDHKRQPFTKHLEWLEKTIKAFATKHDCLLNIDQELEASSCKYLFRPLITAIFSSNLSASEAASVEIKRAINHNNFTAPEASSLLGTLLQRWATHYSHSL